jgi:hypothetical protein
MTMHKKHHYRELLSIGFPIIIGQLGTIILGFADTLMIGHHSTPELAMGFCHGDYQGNRNGNDLYHGACGYHLRSHHAQLSLCQWF